MIGICPNCNEDIFIHDNVEVFDSIRCSICGEPLKVTCVNPLEIDYDMIEYGYEDDDD